MDCLQSWEATRLHRLQFTPKHNVRWSPIRIHKQHTPRVAPIAHVSQHAHERGDSNACCDKHQVVAWVKNMRESAEGTVDGRQVARLDAPDGRCEVPALLH